MAPQDSPGFKGPRSEPEAWVQCDRCKRWRKVPQSYAGGLSASTDWHCVLNPDEQHNRCSIPQELSDAEIDRRQEEHSGSTEESGEVSSETTSSAACPRQWLPVWQLITRNRIQQGSKAAGQGGKAEVMVCQCKRPPPRERRTTSCGGSCLNRQMHIECLPDLCPCGPLCANQRFTRREWARLEVRRAGPKGFGLFSAQDLQAGQFVVEYVGEVVGEAEFRRRRDFLRRVGGTRHFYFMSLSSGAVIDATRRGGLARFANHSCEPNCETQKWVVRGQPVIGLFARQDISSGSELTFDYKLEPFDKPLTCLCGAQSCSGVIGGGQSRAGSGRRMRARLKAVAESEEGGDKEEEGEQAEPEQIMVAEHEQDAAAEGILDRVVGLGWEKGWAPSLSNRLLKMASKQGIDVTRLAEKMEGAVSAALKAAAAAEAGVDSDSDGTSDEATAAPAAGASRVQQASMAGRAQQHLRQRHQQQRQHGGKPCQEGQTLRTGRDQAADRPAAACRLAGEEKGASQPMPVLQQHQHQHRQQASTSPVPLQPAAVQVVPAVPSAAAIQPARLETAVATMQIVQPSGVPMQLWSSSSRQFSGWPYPSGATSTSQYSGQTLLTGSGAAAAAAAAQGASLPPAGMPGLVSDNVPPPLITEMLPPITSQPWRRKINKSMMKHIINMKGKQLMDKFSWRLDHGMPRMVLYVGGKAVEVEQGQHGQQQAWGKVMEFNKEGRDGYPFKTRWVAEMLDALKARIGDTLVLQHRFTDPEKVIHVDASLNDVPADGKLGADEDEGEEEEGDGELSALFNHTSGSYTASEQSTQHGRGEVVDQPPLKRQRADSPGSQYMGVEEDTERPGAGPLECPHCGKAYIYRAPYEKHFKVCEREHRKNKKRELEQQQKARQEVGASFDSLLKAAEELNDGAPADAAADAAAPASAPQQHLNRSRVDSSPGPPGVAGAPALLASAAGGQQAAPAIKAEAAFPPLPADMQSPGSSMPRQQPAPASAAAQLPAGAGAGLSGPAESAQQQRSAQPPQRSASISVQRGGFTPKPHVVRKKLEATSLGKDIIEAYMKLWDTMAESMQQREWVGIRSCLTSDDMAGLEEQLDCMVQGGEDGVVPKAHVLRRKLEATTLEQELVQAYMELYDTWPESMQQREWVGIRDCLTTDDMDSLEEQLSCML